MPSMALVSTFPNNVFKTECGNCYKEGTVENDPHGCADETNICECKTGYAGIRCDQCEKYHRNRGTDREPQCDRKWRVTV